MIAYRRGFRAKQESKCPYSKYDLKLYCAWKGGKFDSEMGYQLDLSMF